MRLIKLGGEFVCKECSRQVQEIYVPAEEQGSAEPGDGACGECTLRKLTEGWQIFPPTTCIPNYFDRELLEEALPALRDASDEDVERIARDIAYDLSDEVCRLFYEFLEMYGDEYEAVVLGRGGEG